jgi:thiamine pyrophosphate-dependent acetolactate synthase large subunit-like protein
VAIVGQQARTSLGGNYQQEVDLATLFKDVAHEYVHMATHPAQMRHLVDRAMRIALDQRTVTCIIVPNDLAARRRSRRRRTSTAPSIPGSATRGHGSCRWTPTSSARHSC